MVWALFAFFAGAMFWTYARLPAFHFFHVSTSGPSGGAGRALVFLNFPTALVAIAIVLIVTDKLEGPVATLAATAAIALCAVVAWPGVVDQNDLDARYVNAMPAIGVALAFVLTVAAARKVVPSFVAWAPGDRVRIVLGLLVSVFALMWITGEFGIFINRIPVLGSIFWARQPWAPFGQANLRPAVHLGHHHGFDGALLALSALVLSRPLGALRRSRRRHVVALYLAIMLAYGLANEVQDDWGEQLVKRGWLHWAIPSVLVPAATPEFLAVLGAGVVLYLLVFRRLAGRREADAARAPLLVPALPIAAALVMVVLGLTAGGRTVRVRGPGAAERQALAVEGPIAFPMAAHGYRLFVIRADGSGLHAATPGKHDVAPSWSPDGRQLAYQKGQGGTADVYVGGSRLTAGGEPSWSTRRGGIAFVSTRAGNRELYLAPPGNGRHPERVTSNGARDEWPSYSSVNRIVFQSNRGGNFDLYMVNEDTSDLHRLTHLPGDELTPAISPEASTIVFAHNGDLWLLGVDYSGRVDRRGLRRLTRGPGTDFAPRWSRDGRFIVFGSDREGRDQIYVIRPDGTGLARLTSRQADKDAPSWG